MEVEYPRLEEVSLVLSEKFSCRYHDCYHQYLQPAIRSIVLYSSTCFGGYDPELTLEKLSRWVSPPKSLLRDIQVSRTYPMTKLTLFALDEAGMADSDSIAVRV